MKLNYRHPYTSDPSLVSPKSPRLAGGQHDQGEENREPRAPVTRRCGSPVGDRQVSSALRGPGFGGKAAHCWVHPRLASRCNWHGARPWGSGARTASSEVGRASPGGRQRERSSGPGSTPPGSGLLLLPTAAGLRSSATPRPAPPPRPRRRPASLTQPHCKPAPGRLAAARPRCAPPWTVPFSPGKDGGARSLQPLD